MQQKQMQGGSALPQSGQPTLKFNLGSGNNFIVKNSNIVITQSNPNGQSNSGSNSLLSQQQQQAMMFAQSKAQQNKIVQSSRNQQQPQQYSLDQKQKIYGQQPPLTNLMAPNNAQKQFNSQGQAQGQRQQRFGNINLTGSTNFNSNTSPPTIPTFNIQNYSQLASPNQQIQASNGFAHKQRQISYSPNMIAPRTKNGKKPRNTSEVPQMNQTNIMRSALDQVYDNQIPNRRSHSKNDKHKDTEFHNNVLAFGAQMQPNSKGLNTSQHLQNTNQRFSPMGYAKAAPSNKTGGSRERQMLNKTGFQPSSSGDGPIVSFIRPQSATQRKNDVTGVSTELNPGLRQLLQQNAQKNNDQRQFQANSKLPGNSLTRNIQMANKTEQGNSKQSYNLIGSNQPSRMSNQQALSSGATNPSAQNDYLNGLLPSANRELANAQGSKEKIKVQGGQLLQNIQKRSQSQHGNNAAKNLTVTQLSEQQNKAGPHALVQQKKPILISSQENQNEADNTADLANGPGHKRPKSNLDGFIKNINSVRKDAKDASNEFPQLDLQNH